MARLRGHRALDVEQPLYVRRAVFTAGGRTFHAGDVFPWRDLGIAARKLHQLWMNRLLGHEKASEKNGAENPAELVKSVSLAPVPVPAVPPVTAQDLPVPARNYHNKRR